MKRWLPYLTGLVIVVLVVALLPAGQMPGFGLGTLAGGGLRVKKCVRNRGFSRIDL